MKEESNNRKNIRRLIPKLSVKDTFNIIIFILCPLSLYATNFVDRLRIVYILLLSVLIISYIFFGQFFLQKEKTSTLGKRVFGLTIINTIILSFIHLSGNIRSPYFFVLYFLIFSVSILTQSSILILECLIVFSSLFILEWHQFSSIKTMFGSMDTVHIVQLFSILVSIPITAALSKFVRDLQKNDELLKVAMNLLELESIEDETLLQEVDHGVIIIDDLGKVVKISKWIEKHFKMNAKLILGRNLAELPFHDTISNKRLTSTNLFYKNITSSSPKTLKWRILYKNQYGKSFKFIIKQNPLLIGGQLKGFLLSVKLPPRTLQDIINTFNQLLIFKLNSSLSMIKTLFFSSKSIQADDAFPAIEKHVKLISRILADTDLKNNIIDGNIEVQVKDFDLKQILDDVKKKIPKVGKLSIWNLSPMYKTKPLTINNDPGLTKKLIEYSIFGSLYLSEDRKINISLDTDPISNNPLISIVTQIAKDYPVSVPVTEPFFGGQLFITRYQGTGLEISNAQLLAQHLDFDFNTGISNNKLVIKISFKTSDV